MISSNVAILVPVLMWEFIFSLIVIITATFCPLPRAYHQAHPAIPQEAFLFQQMQKLWRVQKTTIIISTLHVARSIWFNRILNWPFSWPNACSAIILAKQGTLLNFNCCWVKFRPAYGTRSQGSAGYTLSPRITIGRFPWTLFRYLWRKFEVIFKLNNRLLYVLNDACFGILGCEENKIFNTSENVLQE